MTCMANVGGKACGAPTFSWSVEHGNRELCSAHYDDWLGRRNVDRAKEILSGLTADEKKKLVEALK